MLPQSAIFGPFADPIRHMFLNPFL